MCWWLALLLLAGVVAAEEGVEEYTEEGVEEFIEECSQEELKTMQKEFLGCSTSYSSEYYQSRGKMDRPSEFQVATCLLISRTIDTCGEQWRRCHGEDDIRKMKDMHIMNLIYQYSTEDDENLGINVNHCDVVREYRESGREEEEESVEDDQCSNSHGIRVQNKYLECSHSSSTQLQESVVDVTDKVIVTNSICKALTTVATVCLKILKECFSDEYIENIRNHQLKDMKNYLYRLVEDRVNNKTLANCKIIKTIEIATEEHEAYETYDDTNDINGNEPMQENDDQEGNELTHIHENRIVEEEESSSLSSSPHIIESESENNKVSKIKSNGGKDNSAEISKSVRETILISFLILIISSKNWL